MKKYVMPTTEILHLESTAFICASNKGGRQGDIGAGGSGSDYADPNWDNQGYGGATDTDEDYGDLNSTAKGSNGLWSDFDDEEW